MSKNRSDSHVKPGYVILGGFGLLTTLTWLISEPTVTTPAAGQLTQLSGGLALTGFACTMILTTRLGLLDRLFGGLDRVYIAHKWVSLISIGLTVIHLVVSRADRPRRRAESPPDLGLPAFVLFIALAVLSLIGHRLTYERWKSAHRLMVIPYVVALVHYVDSSPSRLSDLAPCRIWLDLLAAAGLISAVYSTLVYPHISFRSRYRITALRQVGPQILELTARAEAAPVRSKPGQFTFVAIPGRGMGPHPFTISAQHDPEIQFTIKALGDHTNRLVAGEIARGDRLIVSRAYGGFDYATGSRRQVWIAGGIGITPFRAFLQAGVPAQYTVDLFYAYHGAEGVYLDELRSCDLPHVRVHLIDDRTAGFLTVELMGQAVNLQAPFEVLFCGPAAMRDALRAGLRDTAITEFRYEEFQFGLPGR